MFSLRKIDTAGIEPALVARRPARTIISIQLRVNFYLDSFHRGPPHRPPGEELCQVEICPKAIGEAGLEPASEYSAMGFTICLLPASPFVPGRTHPVFLRKTEDSTYRDLPPYTITRFDVISRSVRGKVGKLTQEELNSHLAACGPSHPVAASHGVRH